MDIEEVTQKQEHLKSDEKEELKIYLRLKRPPSKGLEARGKENQWNWKLTKVPNLSTLNHIKYLKHTEQLQRKR